MQPYKLSKVYNGKTEWFISFRYWDLRTRKYEGDRIYLGMHGLTKNERQVLLEELKGILDKEIRSRNRRGVYHDKGKRQAREKYIGRTILDWIDLTAKDPKIEKSWHKTFSELRFNIEKFYKVHTLYDKAYAEDIDDGFVGIYVDYLQEDGKASKTINKHLWGLQTLTEWIHKSNKEIPVYSTKEFRVEEIKNETGKYPPLTHEEKEACFAYFKQFNPEMYLFLLCQYYTCIRPAELHRLKVENFDLKGRKIHVPFYDSKSGNSNYVQILQPLGRALADFDIKSIPPGHYLFGDCCKPSEKPYNDKTIYESSVWLKNRVRMGMPKNKQLYGLKHTFNIDYVENNKKNVDWEWLRRHNRHATVQQTQQYISSLTAYFLDEDENVILDYHC